MAIEPLTTVQGYTGQEINVYDENFDNSKMDQEDFLKVLLANFKYQDPFEAQDIDKFIDNTIKLRELEVLNNFEKSVNTLSGGTEQLLSAANLIGKKVLYDGGTTYVANGKSHVEVKLDQKADFLGVYLYDENGNIVYKKELNDTFLPDEYIPFDIDDPNLQDGVYKVGIVAKNGEESVQSSIRSIGLVKEAMRGDQGIVLSINDNENIALDNVYSIGG